MKFGYKMIKSIRYTNEKRQELISNGQIYERFADYGWLLTKPDEDLGEDYLVHIYYQRQATGVIFHLQLKSVSNLENRRVGNYIKYSNIKIKDLKHWENFRFPVVLIIWDINLREGRWILISDIIADLDKRNSNWRNNRTYTQVLIPWENKTDNMGLDNLRYKIGKVIFPLIKGNKELDMKMTLNFSDLENGTEAATALYKFYKEGGEVTFNGEAVKEIELPEWAEPWFKFDYGKNVEITFKSRPSEKTICTDLLLIGNNGDIAYLKGAEFKIYRSSEEIIELSNRDQLFPLHLNFIFNFAQQNTGSFTVNNWGNNVFLTREVLNFMSIFATGGNLRLLLQNNGLITPIDIPIPPSPKFTPDPGFIQLVNDLCLIQSKIGKIISIPSASLTDQEQRIIYELVEIVKYGKVITKYHPDHHFEVNVPKSEYNGQRQGEVISYTTTYESSSATIFNQTIDMGKMSQTITFIIIMSDNEIDNILLENSNELFLPLKCKNVEIISDYTDWPIRESHN